MANASRFHCHRFPNIVGWFIVFAFFASTVGVTAEVEAEFTPEIRQFFKLHCFECHGASKQEADLRIDTLSPDFSDRFEAEKWSEILDRLNRGDMPPKDQARPSPQHQNKVVDWITAELHSVIEQRQQTGGHVVLRRLNRGQYNNTIRDLVGVEYNPADSFPEDPSGFGFDNVGSALSLSPLHIEQYVETAREIIERANLDGVRPQPFKWHFEPERAARQKKEIRLTRPDRRGRPIQYAVMYARDMPARGDFAVIRMKRRRDVGIRRFQIHRTGRYIVRIRAAAHVPSRAEVESAAAKLNLRRFESQLAKDKSAAERRKRTDYWERVHKKMLQDHFATDSMYDYGPPRLRTTFDGTIPLPCVDVSVDEEHAQVYEFPVFLVAKWYDMKISNDYNIPEVAENVTIVHHDEFPRPELLIDWFEIEGPLDSEWPPKSRQRILRSFPKTDPELLRARKIIATFMKRAYRRPVRTQEVDRMMKLYSMARKNSDSLEQALTVPLTSVLSSPNFLHLVESDPIDGDTRVGEYELASRLSYWLWNTMPDADLFKLAKKNQLREKDILLQQIDRMLRDPRSDAFIESFVTQWLQIRDLHSVIPDKRRYSRFDEHLLTSFQQESVSFFRELLDSDLSISNFLDSEFAVVNQRLARHYQLPKLDGDHFRRVNLPPDVERGSLLAQASIHMATSNGTRTSPVKRGTWILENIFDTPPPPPPPNVGDIQPGVPGIDKATVRERLEAHRNNAACASCHDRIDPLGFALENYDAIGRWRDQEGFGFLGQVRKYDPVIDSHGKLPDGSEFANIQELKRVLNDKRSMFYRCFVRKMMIYALGRGLELTDRPEVDSILENLPNHKHTIRGIIKDIALSKAFLHKSAGAKP